MSRLFKTFFIVCSILIVPLCYANKEKVVTNKTDKIEQKSQVVSTWIIVNDNQNNQSWIENVLWDDEIIEQKSNSWELTEEEKKITKWLNTLFIESTKIRFTTLLNNISFKIKDKKKEDKIKILSSLIIAIKPRIELINSWKISLTENRKEVLSALLTYIIQDTEKRIQSILKEK